MASSDRRIPEGVTSSSEVRITGATDGVASTFGTRSSDERSACSSSSEDEGGAGAAVAAAARLGKGGDAEAATGTGTTAGRGTRWD